MAVLEEILTALLAGFVYGFTHYLKKAQNGEKFDPWKLAATEVVAVAVALALALNGQVVNQLTWEQKFIIYAGAIPIVENILKALWRWLKRSEKEKPKAKLVEVRKRSPS